MTWAKAAMEPSRAMVRGSPKRRPGARWPSWTVGSTTDFEGGGIGQAWLSFAERGQEPGVGVGPDTAQRPPVVGVECLVHGEVVSVVDRRFHPQSPALFEVGLGLGGLVVDLQLGGDVTGDDLGGEPSRRLVPAPVDDACG